MIEACLRNESQAQQFLYNKYASAVMGVCLRYIVDYHIAQDVLQDAFIKIFNNLHKFRLESSLKTWMRNIAANTAIDYLRRNKKSQLWMHLDEEIENIPDLQLDSEEENLVLDPESVFEMMKLLPDRYRICLNLFAIEKYPYKEIAQMLNMNEGTCRGNVAKARILLAKMIDDKKKVNSHAE